MVELNTQNINIRTSNSDIKLNSNTISKIKITKETPLFLQKYDTNHDGTISQDEAMKMLNDLQKAAGNDKLTAKEFEKAGFGTKEDYKNFEKTVQNNSKAQTSQQTEVKSETSKTKEVSNSKTEQNDSAKTGKKTSENNVKTIQNQDGSTTKITDLGNGVKQQERFDKEGKLLSKTTASSKGSATTTYEYSSAGKVISDKTISKDKAGNQTGFGENKYTFDAQGNTTSKSTNIYDKNGVCTRTTVTKYENNAEGKPVKSTTTVTNPKTQKTIQSQTNEYSYQNGVCSSCTSKTLTEDGISVVQKQYQQDGKSLSHVVDDTTYKDGTTKHVEVTYSSSGKVTTNHAVNKAKNGTITSETNSTYEYQSDGKTLKKYSMTGTEDGKPISQNIQYDEHGKMTTFDSMYYERGKKFVNHSEGENIENRRGSVPTTRIEYEKDGKTIKTITTNKFDKDGVLLSEEVKDKDGNVISTHDFSQVDGKFDTSYQKGRGNCYMLAGLNSLRESSEGQALLKQNITVGKDPKTGETTYTITFPGAKEARQKLLDAGVPADQIDIKESYTYTESEIHEKAKEAGLKYSAGDKDVLVLEVAYEQYRTDGLNDFNDAVKANPQFKNEALGNKLKKDIGIRGVNAIEGDALSAGQSSDTIFLLTGKHGKELNVRNGDPSTSPVCVVGDNYAMEIKGDGKALTSEQNAQIDAYLDTVAKDCKDGKLDNYAATASFVVSSQTVNGQELKGVGHAFSITKVDDNNVYLANPWDPTKEIVMTRDEFKKAVTNVSVTPLNAEGEKGAQNISNGKTTGKTDGTEKTGNNGGSTSKEVTNTPQAGKAYKVPEGKGFKTLIKEALIAQGIEPNAENMEKAIEQFKAQNKSGWGIYNGSNAKFRGNAMLYKGATVIIPKFDIE